MERQDRPERKPDFKTQHIIETISVLKKGGLIIYPTDTIWGIGCDATNDSAVEKLLKLKERDYSKGLIILLDHIDKLGRYVQEIPYQAQQLWEFSDKPLTVILDKPCGLSPHVSSQGRIAVRILQEDSFTKSLLYRFGKPIVSTSINISGSDKTPQTFNEIPAEFLSTVDFVVDKRFDFGTRKASSIISITNSGEVKIIRE